MRGWPFTRGILHMFSLISRTLLVCLRKIHFSMFFIFWQIKWNCAHVGEDIMRGIRYNLIWRDYKDRCLVFDAKSIHYHCWWLGVNLKYFVNLFDIVLLDSKWGNTEVYIVFYLYLRFLRERSWYWKGFWECNEVMDNRWVQGGHSNELKDWQGCFGGLQRFCSRMLSVS